MRKTAVWRILCFTPLSPLNNVQEQLAKLESSHVICLQHFIGGENENLYALSKISIFCH